jgi:hypothetical protein
MVLYKYLYICVCVRYTDIHGTMISYHNNDMPVKSGNTRYISTKGAMHCYFNAQPTLLAGKNNY